MRKNICQLLALVVLLTVSCKKKDFLDTKPLSQYGEDDFWSSPGLVEGFVNGMYRDMYRQPFDWEPLACFSGDEGWFNEGMAVSDFNKTVLISPDLIPGWDDGSNGWSPHTINLLWGNLYKLVRKTNLFFTHAGDIQSVDTAWINRMKGEAYYLRAGAYFLLTNMYGGVPLITKPYTLTDTFNVKRNTYAECINFITSQLDTAAMYLPMNIGGADQGRATVGAALGLKSRVLLYAASDLHNKMDSYASGFAHKELIGYVDGSQTERWQKAKDAAKAVIDLGMYSLYKPNPAPGDPVDQNFIDLFLSKSPTSEDIFMQYFNTKLNEDWFGYNPGLFWGPNGYHGWGGNAPFQDLVDAYEMKDGSKFDWNNPAHKTAPYTNRDARFYATMLYDGASWRPRPADVQAIDPWNRLQTGNVVDPSGNVLVLGADNGLVDNWGPFTGYFVRKFIDPNVDFNSNLQDIPFRPMRYAEILMNYAEACIELGLDGEGRDYLNMIRTRAGQPPTSESGDALKARYRNERRVEFAFEDQYFWDIRRWVAGPSAYHPVHRILIKYVTNQPATTYFKSDGTPWSAPVYSTEVVDNFAWNDKAYFFPISRTEVNKNPLLIQNPGY